MELRREAFLGRVLDVCLVVGEGGADPPDQSRLSWSPVVPALLEDFHQEPADVFLDLAHD